MKIRMAVLILFLLAIRPFASFAQEKIQLINYGPEATTAEGDHDYMQMLFFKIPVGFSDSLYLRIFDADCGDVLDSPFDGFDTETRFRLFGGIGAFSSASLLQDMPGRDRLDTGTLIAGERVAQDPFKDNKWFNLASFAASEGEEVGDYFYFKLIVEGLSGNDGNVFDVTVSTREKQNSLPEGLKLFSYIPTIRLPREGIFAELRFFVADSIESVQVHNFDLANARVGCETVFRSNLRVVASGQNEWADSRVDFNPNETNQYAAITFEGGNETPNDATFFIKDVEGRSLPVELPVYVWTKNSRPIPQVETKMLSDCRTVVFDGSRSSDRDGDALTYDWDFGDGGSGQGVRVSHRYEGIGPYEARLIVRDASGQIGNGAFVMHPVVINLPPIAEAGEDRAVAPGQGLQFDGSQSSDPDGSITRYSWDLGDGHRDEGAAVSHAYRKAGKYTATLRVEDNSGSPCNSASDQLTVVVNASPVVEIGPDLISSPGEPVNFNGGRSYDSDGEIADYIWDFGDGGSGEGQIIDHSYDSPGTYRVVLTIRDNTDLENNSASDQLTVKVNDRPVAAAGDDRRASVGERILFDGSASNDRDGEIVEFSWDFGDGGTGDAVKSEHAYNAPGTYTVQLKVQDNSTSTSDTDTDELTIIVNNPPVASAGEDQWVTSSELRFDGTNSSDEDGQITQYLWDFGDGQQSTESAPVHVYARPGRYEVMLTVTDDSETSTNTATDALIVTVNQKPIADAGMAIVGAPGQSLSFDGSGSVDPDGNLAGAEWDFGDGNTETGQTVTHVFDKPGTYAVRLSVKDNTGHPAAVDYDEIKVTVNQKPVADAGPDLYAAPGQTLVFDGGQSYDMDGNITAYNWRFSDGDEQNSAQVERSFDQPGIYSATLSIHDESGAPNAHAEDQCSIFINHRPVSRAGDDQFTCSTTLKFDGSKSTDADGHPLKYRWDFGDGTPADSGITAVHTYASAGSFPVILTVNDGTGLENAVHESSLTVTINEPPYANAGDERTLCAGDVVLFDGAGSIDPEGGLLKYYWDFGDGEKAEGLNPTKIFKEGGVYQVTLTVKDDSGLPCNSDMDQVVIRVAESPVADAGEDLTVCANNVVEFDGTGSKDFDGVVNVFSWDFGDGSTGGGAKPTHVYVQPGTYRVLLTITGDQVGQCDNTDKDEMTVTVVDAPVATFTHDSLVAVNSNVYFDGSESAAEGAELISWDWNFGDGTSGEGPTAEHTYTEPGKYFVTLTVKTGIESVCNSNSTTDYIIVNGAPAAMAGEDRFAAVNEVIMFNGADSKDSDGSVVSFNWDFGDGNQADGLEVRHQFAGSGEYAVILTVKDNTSLMNNWSTDTVMVRINSAPIPVIQAPVWASAEEAVEFNALQSTDSDGQLIAYHWEFGDGESSDSAMTTHVYGNPGFYEVVLSVKDDSKLDNQMSKTTHIIHINRPPYADAGPDRIVCPREPLTVDGSGSADLDGTLISYRWDFGDGTGDEGRQVTHIYSEPGEYQLTLSVTDQSGSMTATSSDTALIRVNSPPVAQAGPDRVTVIGGAHDAVQFDASGSFDADGDPLMYFWDFGDGTTETGAKVEHLYQSEGTYTVRLTVRDGSGSSCNEGRDEVTVQVNAR
ncbi:hypothetical protein BVY01_05045 [bacterium I07]|nr:hypothetical protein BVY01_05045 [bacterium I07]